jgi:hypothetical protein
VDSIRYTRVENLPRKIFYISNFKYSINYSNNRLGGRPEIWIEGIGSSWRLERDECKNYYLLGDNNTRWNSLCFYRNEKLLYHFPGFNDCYYHWVVGNPEIGSNLDFQLYPNPSSGKFTIRSGAENGNSRVQVFDISGRQVRSLQTDGSGYLEVDLSNVSPGTYLFRLSKSGSSGTRKVVIN